MTSSVFIESSSLPSDATELSGTDSNLVVVYGKNSISFDDQGLENIISEKQISSISVIRLTSPTPSMTEEEEKSAEKSRRHELFSGDSSGNEERANPSADSGSDDDSSACREDQMCERYDRILHDEDAEQANTRHRTTLRPRRYQSNAARQTRPSRKRKTVRPEVVGLRLEEFYPPEEANVIIKEALKMAGLGPNRKSKADIELQLLAIRNDHCYTPFTSPTQMKAKLAADKLDIEMQGTSRKVIGAHQGGAGGKQVFVRRKIIQKEQTTPVKPPSAYPTAKEKGSLSTTSKLKRFATEANPQFESDRDGNTNTTRTSNDDCDENEGSEYGPSADESAESDNDRDSDLDFDVNNPKGRRRKLKLAKAIKRHSAGTLRSNQKMKRLHSQEDTGDMIKRNITTPPSRQKCLLKTSSDVGRIVARSNPLKSIHGLSGTSNPVKPVTGTINPVKALSGTSNPVKALFGTSNPVKALTPSVAPVPLIPRISNDNKYNTSTSLLPCEPSTSTKSSLKTSIVKGSGAFNVPQQSHREILINKQIMSTPKIKGFTEISALIDQGKKEEPKYQVESVKLVNKPVALDGLTSQKSLLHYKGFTPIGLEMVTKNQLPAQISIQTHQSSSELEAENDKQLDLINSIVQNELKKSNEVVTPATNINENIPKLVKMLESTEKVLEGNNISKNADNRSNKMNDSHECANENIYGNHGSQSNDNAISVIDINNASLLVTSDGDDGLPDDILQLVDMIPDEKTLQEAVKELDSGNCNEDGRVVSPKPPPLTLITPQFSSKNQNTLEDIPHSSKSIIQMSISNLPISPMTPSAPVTSRALSSKPSPVLRSEPIQIIRGNGRVITLPPIEAPTTRAKRRAQVQPHSILQNNVVSPVASAGVSTIITESSRENLMPSNFAATPASSLGQEKQSLDNSNRPRNSKDLVTAGGSIASQKPRGKSSTSSRKVKSKLQSEVEASESANEDDDDPNKLWCICRQPHNNRFMICCDACEDWFHGTCVNITKAMGLEMEQKGIDWTCPKCIKKQEEKKQPKITDMMPKRPMETRPQFPSTTIAESPVAGTPVGNVSLLNIQATNFANKQPSEVTQTVIDTSKTRMQPGQFINLKDLNSGGKKVLIQAASNTNFGQKKLFLTTQPLKNTSTTLTTPIRTIAVVKHISGNVSQMNPHQSIKVIRTITPAKSTAQNFITTPASDSVSKLAGANEKSTCCIVCKKNARLNSIYCSDDCIRKHAQNALQTFMNKSNSEMDTSLVSNTIDEKAKKKTKGLFEDLLSMADRKPKVERINVYERKSGRILTGPSAPTIANLKKWLQENPTFEVVQPGSSQALDLEKKHKLRAQHSPSPTAHPKATSSPPPLKLLPMTSSGPQKTDPIGSNSPQTPASVTLLKQTLTPLKPNQKSILDFGKSSSPSNTSRPGTPKQLQKYHVVSIKSDRTQKTTEDVKSTKEKAHSTKKQTNSEISTSKSSSNDGEPIRLLVRRTLKEQLLLRTHEEHNSECDVNSTDNLNLPDFPKLTPEAIQEFANSTELEMYNYFNRDAGTKYKAKYRSLIFNIKDRKNHTLFAKICQNQIEPKQLVRMTPDEMASQELAQWRKQENKHQLEMIKKSELDLLTCAKNYVLKTHKGEEVIESKSTEYENVDLSIPVEDVVAALNKTNIAQEPSTTAKSQSLWSDVDSTILTFPLASEQPPPPVEEKPKSSKDKDKDRHRERNRNLDDRDQEKRQKSKDPYRDRSRSRKRSRSHSRSRSCERNDKRHKSSHKDEKRDRDKDRAKERTDQHSDGKSNDKKPEKKPGNASKLRESYPLKKHVLHESCANSLETYNLIDQILESTKTVEEAANLVPDKEKGIEVARKSSSTPLPSQSISSTTTKGSVESYVIDIPSSPNNADSDQEPTSTVSIPTPPHDPYVRFMHASSPSPEATTRSNVNSLWIGDINMVDVASFQLSIQSVLGNCFGLAKLLAKELDVVGRIGPETVWDYISKIKKSPNKEILIIRLVPASESETSAYKILYEYLDKRKRLGVVKSVSPYIKDFYIFPLGAGKQMPTVLLHSEPVEFYDDPFRPDMLMGIVIRVVAKRHNLAVPSNSVGVVTSTIAGHSKVGSRSSEGGDSLQSPPGSPKFKKRRQSIAPKDIDVDAIIKAPIVSKSQKGISNTVSTVHAMMDADEPYSPGGSSDDDVPLLPVKVPSNSNQTQTPEDELKRKMEEINRQIAAQEMEIAGLLTGETSKFGSSSSKTAKVLANIAIPSNLSQILASIKPTGISQESFTGLTPPPPLIGSLLRKTDGPSTSSAATERINPTYEVKNTSSRLANLSEAELLSMVPDHIAIAPKPPPVTRYKEPPPPGV